MTFSLLANVSNVKLFLYNTSCESVISSYKLLLVICRSSQYYKLVLSLDIN